MKLTTNKLNSKHLPLIAIISAFAVIPAMVVLYVGYAMFSVSTGEFAFGSEILDRFKAAMVMAFMGICVSIPAAIIYGIPVYFFLLHFNVLNIYTITIVTLLPATFFGFSGKSVITFLFVGYFSLCVAYAFCFLASSKAFSHLLKR